MYFYSDQFTIQVTNVPAKDGYRQWEENHFCYHYSPLSRLRVSNTPFVLVPSVRLFPVGSYSM